MKSYVSNRYAAMLTVVYVSTNVNSEVSPKDADEIKALPGWNKALPSKHYSGYLPVANGTRHMHYYFQESENSPSTDPVTLWMNGGPGCTSLKGGFEELGQLVFNYKSMINPGTPTLSYNPYSWTTVSNLLMFESPPGVGFSYCDECLGTSRIFSYVEKARLSVLSICMHHDILTIFIERSLVGVNDEFGDSVVFRCFET
eukprot:m.1111866 g.1111866  ORF g.1111866 m.1111866 type:complete len:200 (-) comp24362_c0_seq23:3406-4005(-)